MLGKKMEIRKRKGCKIKLFLLYTNENSERNRKIREEEKKKKQKRDERAYQPSFNRIACVIPNFKLISQFGITSTRFKLRNCFSPLPPSCSSSPLKASPFHLCSLMLCAIFRRDYYIEIYWEGSARPSKIYITNF